MRRRPARPGSLVPFQAALTASRRASVPARCRIRTPRWDRMVASHFYPPVQFAQQQASGANRPTDSVEYSPPGSQLAASAIPGIIRITWQFPNRPSPSGSWSGGDASSHVCLRVWNVRIVSEFVFFFYLSFVFSWPWSVIIFFPPRQRLPPF